MKITLIITLIIATLVPIRADLADFGPPLGDKIDYSEENAAAASEATGESFKISSTGKRHNSSCRYYDSRGRFTNNRNEGIACKICGG
jgi:hypothetical protein